MEKRFFGDKKKVGSCLGQEGQKVLLLLKGYSNQVLYIKDKEVKLTIN